MELSRLLSAWDTCQSSLIPLGAGKIAGLEFAMGASIQADIMHQYMYSFEYDKSSSVRQILAFFFLSIFIYSIFIFIYTVISICEDSGVEIDPKDIEGCHRRPLSRYSTEQDKRVIVKFVNWKLSEALLRDKKRISSKSFNHLNVPNKAFVSVSFCPYYRYIWGRCKDLQRQGQINHSFCLGGVLCIKLSENGNPIKPYHMNDIPDFPSE